MINDLLKKIVELKGSDLFFTIGVPPCIKINGVIKNLYDDVLTAKQIQEIISSLMTEQQQQQFLQTKESNFAIQTKEGRFRVNAFYQRGNIGLVLRRIESHIPQLKELGIPDKLAEFIMYQRGLVILVGGTGSGKSSTLAAMIGYRNRNSTDHIITIEDPIEFIHQHDKSIITQREIGIDTASFAIALKNALRQSPNVIVIGEIRSQEIMNYAINFAETGHLCIATLHANNANQAMDRMINLLPAEKHQQLLNDLALNLKAVVAQQLIPSSSGNSRIPCLEILINTPVVSDAIKKGEIKVLKEYMSKGATVGMRTFDQGLFELYQAGKITYENALKHADSENELRLMIKLSKGSNEGNSDLDKVRLQS